MFQFAIPITEDCYFAELLGIIPVPVFQFAIPITEDCYFLSPIEQRQESGFNSQSPLLRIVILKALCVEIEIVKFQFAIPITEDCYFNATIAAILACVFQFAIPITEDCYALP